MKKLMLKFFHVIMAVVVLMSSTGFGLVEHSCTLKGKTSSLHRSTVGCCAKHSSNKFSKQNQTQVRKSACCSEDEKYENVEYSSSVSQLVAKFVQKSVESFHAVIHSFVFEVIDSITEAVTSLRTSHQNSPPKGQVLRILYQSFTI